MADSLHDASRRLPGDSAERAREATGGGLVGSQHEIDLGAVAVDAARAVRPREEAVRIRSWAGGPRLGPPPQPGGEATGAHLVVRRPAIDEARGRAAPNKAERVTRPLVD